MAGDDWTPVEHLLAVVADAVRTGNWQRQGKQGAPRPDPISPLAKRHKPETTAGDAGGRTQQDVDGLLHAMRTGAFGG